MSHHHHRSLEAKPVHHKHHKHHKRYGNDTSTPGHANKKPNYLVAFLIVAVLMMLGRLTVQNDSNPDNYTHATTTTTKVDKPTAIVVERNP